MKLERIAITNYQGIADVDVSPSKPVILFCGPNAAGKSSLVEAIKLASIGEPTRVEKKKDWKQLIHNGSKSGSIIIDSDSGRMSVQLPTGKQVVPGPISDSLPFVMDAKRFGSMAHKERHQFLFRLVGVEVTLEAMRKLFASRGLLSEVIEGVMPMLRGGFDAAADAAMTRVSELRGKWESITQEKYGPIKGDTWEATGNPHKADADRLEVINITLPALEQKLEHLNRKLGSAQAYLAQQERLRALADAGKPDPAAIEEEITTAKKAAAKQEDKCKILRQAVEDARLEAQPCPGCGKALKVTSRKKIILADPDASHDALPALEEKLRDAEGVHSALTAAIESAQERLRNAIADTRAVAAAKEVLKDTYTEQQKEQFETEIQAINIERGELRRERDAIKQEIEAAKDHAGKTSRARETHRMILAWTAMAEALGSEGIPAELLAKALGPINERMQMSAKRAEWPEVRIDASMEIFMSGRPYYLLSESERWRADALLSEAVAHLSETKLLILDRLDVLRPQDRGSVLDWAHWLAGQGYQVLLTATLKAKPDLDDVDVYWIDSGRIAP